MKIFNRKFSAFPLLFIVILCQFMASCKFLTPSVMLRTGSDYPYAKFDSIIDEKDRQYKISINDELSIILYSDGGSSLIDVVGGGGYNTGNSSSGSFMSGGSQQRYGTSGSSGGSMYIVDFDGTVRIPVLGRVKLEGMTLREAEVFLEKSFSKFYNLPFVMIRVLNRRVFLFKGLGNNASVLTLKNENTSLFEAIAMSGGIDEMSKAYRIKLIRGNLKDPKVYLIDLSTLNGVTQADLILQANDIIYIEPIQNYPERFLERISPYLTAINSGIVAVLFVQSFLFTDSSNTQ